MKALWRSILIHALFLGLLLGFFYVFQLAAQREEVDKFNRQVEDKVQGIEESIKVLEEISGGDGTMSRLREEIEMLKGRFVPYELLEEVSWELADLAKEAGLNPTRIIPPMGREGEEVERDTESGLIMEKLPIVIEMNGEFLKYGQFLQTLEHFPYHVVVKELVISSEEPDGLHLSIKTEFSVFSISEDTIDAAG
ncbi:MAG: hypothetical protein ACE5OP_01070 [Candidatus Glassbacteria bacterium]